MEAHFRILGIGVTLTAPSAIAGPIASAYRRFALTRPDSARSIHIVLDSSEADRIRVNDREVPALREIDLTLQLYQQFLMAVFDRIESHALIHAAAMTDSMGGSFLLAGPSGHGKTSLTLELVRRGRGFLTDDYAPFDLSNRTISPFPRAVGIAPQGQAFIPERFTNRSVDPSATRLFGKTLLDVGEILGEECVVREPAPLRHVIILDGSRTAGPDRPASTLIQLILRANDAERIERELSAMEDVEILERQSLERARSLTVLSRRSLTRILQDEAIIVSQRLPALEPEFSATPELAPIKRSEAAMSLCRELLNRREGGRFLSRYGGNPARLLVELAGALRDSECSRLSVGNYRAMVELIDGLVSRR